MYKYLKRILDIISAVLILVLLFIPFLLVSILIKLEDKGPIIFKQIRTGKNGKPFKLYKFRTMKVNVKEYTKVGKFLKKISFDETPQLLNIIKGEMSFIGPRPWIPEYFDAMNEKERERTKVLPGITGLAQVSGRNAISINEKIKYDLIYVNKISFTKDLYILLKTLFAVFEPIGSTIDNNGIKKEIEILKKQNK